MTAVSAHLNQPPVARRGALLAAAALVLVAVVHLLDGPGSLGEQPYVGVLELALAAASVPLALGLIVRPTRELWLSTAALAGTALAVYVASRTIGLPSSTDDIGNWSSALGVLNVASEAMLIVLAAAALSLRR